jgi:hypothetical protein
MGAGVVMTTVQLQRAYHVCPPAPEEWPLVCNEELRTMAVDLTKPGKISVDAYNKQTGEMKQYILKITRRGIALL